MAGALACWHFGREGVLAWVCVVRPPKCYGGCAPRLTALHCQDTLPGMQTREADRRTSSALALPWPGVRQPRTARCPWTDLAPVWRAHKCSTMAGVCSRP